jgi:ribosome-associated protein
MTTPYNIPDLTCELEFVTARSSGAGGQHVNKTESKVSLFFYIEKSNILTENQKQTIRKKLQNKINLDNAIYLSSELTRSQFQNKADCIEKFNKLIEKALIPEKIRKSSFPSGKWHEIRLKFKRAQAEKKQRRREDFE